MSPSSHAQQIDPSRHRRPGGRGTREDVSGSLGREVMEVVCMYSTDCLAKRLRINAGFSGPRDPCAIMTIRAANLNMFMIVLTELPKMTNAAAS